MSEHKRREHYNGPALSHEVFLQVKVLHLSFTKLTFVEGSDAWLGMTMTLLTVVTTLQGLRLREPTSCALERP